MLIGGYAVNYHGYNRNTDDMDVWLAPTNENKNVFINTLLCMNYSANEVEALHHEDFTNYFVGHIGPADSRIDVLTIVHHTILFDEAEKEKHVFEIEPGIFMNIVSYDTLKDIKLLSRRPKDLWDVVRLDELRNQKNKK